MLDGPMLDFPMPPDSCQLFIPLIPVILMGNAHSGRGAADARRQNPGK
jgi:hypothetical protein